MSNQPSKTQQQPKQQGSDFTNEELKNFDFRRLPSEEILLLQRLSFFSVHNQLYKVMVEEHGAKGMKEQFIKDNLGYISESDSADFMIAQRKYFENSIKIPTMITSITTISAFMVGLWILPSRMSTFRYTMGGLTLGLVLSYGYWRHQMSQYYKTLNKHFKSISKEKYLQNKMRSK